MVSTLAATNGAHRCEFLVNDALGENAKDVLISSSQPTRHVVHTRSRRLTMDVRSSSLESLRT